MLATILDPADKFLHVSPVDIEASLGLIMGWATYADDYSGFQECLLEHYGEFYGGPLTDGHITDEGSFVYPGDPESYPLAKWETAGEVMYQYQHAMVAVVNKATGDQWITRMD